MKRFHKLLVAAVPLAAFLFYFFLSARPAAAQGLVYIITPEVMGELDENGWYISDVTVTWPALPVGAINIVGCMDIIIVDDTAGQSETCTFEVEGRFVVGGVTIRRGATAGNCPAPPTGDFFRNNPTFGVVCDAGGRNITFETATLNDEPAVRITGLAGETTAIISVCYGNDDVMLHEVDPADELRLVVQCGSANFAVESGTVTAELSSAGNLVAEVTALSGAELYFQSLDFGGELRQQFYLASGAFLLKTYDASGNAFALADLTEANTLLIDQQLGRMEATLGSFEMQLINLSGAAFALATLDAGAGNALLFDQQLGQMEALFNSVQIQFLDAAQNVLIDASLDAGSIASFELTLGALEVLQGAVDAAWLDQAGSEIASGLIQAGQEVIFNQLLTQFQVSSLGGLVNMVFQGQGEFNVLAGGLDLSLLDLVGNIVGRLSMDSGDSALWDYVQSTLTIDAGFMNLLLIDESGVFSQALLNSGEIIDISSARNPLDILNAVLELSFMDLTGPSLGPPVSFGSDNVILPLTSVPLSAVGQLDVRAAGNVHPNGLNPDIFQNYITDVWAWGNYAYLGTFDRPLCSPQTTGVHIIDISNPAAPAYSGFVPSPDGTRPNDVKVAHLETEQFSGEIMVHTNERCNLGWIPDIDTGGPIGLPLTDVELGVGIYDVTDPLNPVELDNSYLDFQTHNSYIWQHGGGAYMLVTEDDNNRGLHIIDITDPSFPVEIAAVDQFVPPLDGDGISTDYPLIAQSGLLGHTPTKHEDGHTGGDVLLHDVWVQENDGQVIAYLSYWDVGMVLLDVTVPDSPIFLGDSDYILPDPVTGGTPAGNMHVAIPTEDGSICIGGDEDFFGEAGWGYGRLFDCRNPADIVEIGQMHTGNIGTPPPGNHTAHNVMVADDLAFWSWYHDGLVAFDFSSCRDANGQPAACTPIEVGRFIAPGGSDFWGVYLHYINGTPYLLGSDRDSGLWIVESPSRPEANDDNPYDATEDMTLDVSAPGVLGDDIDLNGDSLTAVIDTSTSSGSVTLNLDGSFTYTPESNFCGSDSFTYHANDAVLDSNVASVTINVVCVNDPPQVNADKPTMTVDEGQNAANSGTVSDIDSASITLSSSVGTVIDNGDGAWSWSFETSDGPAQSQQVTITGDDGDGGSAEATFQLTVNNVDPTITSFTVPLDPVNINDQSSFSAGVSFSDPAGMDDEYYTCEFDLDFDGVNFQADATNFPVTGSLCSTLLNYPEPGVYTVRVIVTDKDSGYGSAETTEFIVIYDPSGGFVTGGGWIWSPAGAYVEDSMLEGKASFGFVSKYTNGASTPNGQTQFQFKAGDLNFHSSSYQWLVIAGPNAKYKGEGTINGGGSYGFMLTATDSDVQDGGTVDTFRIKIWDKDNDDTVIYDNQMGAGDAEYIGTDLSGGNIKIHK